VAGSFRAKAVDFLLAIRSRRNSPCREAPDLTFDGTLISDMGFETIFREALSEPRFVVS
jgi:hypothetical protein